MKTQKQTNSVTGRAIEAGETLYEVAEASATASALSCIPKIEDRCQIQLCASSSAKAFRGRRWKGGLVFLYITS